MLDNNNNYYYNYRTQYGAEYLVPQ